MRVGWAGRVALGALIVFTLVVLLIPSSAPHLATSSINAGSSRAQALGSPAPSASAIAALSLGINANPPAICAYGLTGCPAGVGLSKVTLTASAANGGVLAWPAVQVAFVIETTLYDGVYDPNAGDTGNFQHPEYCANRGQMLPCEESNGVPFFVHNAQEIGNAIQAANPHSQVSFALVDYFKTADNYDDYDGSEYHVDIQQFVPSAYFGNAVTSTFQAQVLGGGYVYGDSDFADNFLHSSMITAMYGTIIGSGLTWSNDTHHVIVWMGSTAPRDPNYPENYCVSSSTLLAPGTTGNACLGGTCEPSYAFLNGVSPNCEGWVRSQDGNATHSIAQLAKTAPSCTGSIGGVCTVDTIDYWTTSTDPLSQGWWPNVGAGDASKQPIIQANVEHVMLAGCDMSAATGGTWNGPAWFTCPDGQQGTLQPVPHGSAAKPNFLNPTLFAALREVGFGPVIESQIAAGTGKPIFSFVPFGNIALPPASQLAVSATCIRHGVELKTCDQGKVYKSATTMYLGWNWSQNKSSNVMFVGDSWSASFYVLATGPPFATVPVDACITTQCRAAGSAAIQGLYTWATYVPYTNQSVVTQSFPLAQLTVEITPGAALVGGPPAPPPPTPPPFAIPAAPPLPVIQQIGIGNNVGVANVSLQATAAGFLGAGFMRVSIKNRPIAMKIAAKSGAVVSKFDKEAASEAASIGRFE